MLSNNLKMDDIDRSIIQIVQDNPSLTHTQIAKKVNRSQPTVGMRIRKLEERGLLKFQAGINLKKLDLCLARVELQAKNPEEIFKLTDTCPFIVNVFKLSGNVNISVLIVALNLEDLDKIVNYHFRNDPKNTKIHMDIITDVAKDFLISFNSEVLECSESCEHSCLK